MLLIQYRQDPSQRNVARHLSFDDGSSSNMTTPMHPNKRARAHDSSSGINHMRMQSFSMVNEAGQGQPFGVLAFQRDGR